MKQLLATLSHWHPKKIDPGSNVRGPIDPNSPEQKELQASIAKHGILQPLLVLVCGILLAGHRRLAAALVLGLESVPVIVTDRMLSDTEIRLIQLAENIHRADLTGFEKWRAAAELLELNPGWQLKDLAEQLHLSPASITQILSPSKCTPAWQEALKAGKVTISACYGASKLTPNEQDGLLALRLSGASPEQIEKATRKPRVVGAGTLSTIKLPLTSGVTVTVRGEDLDGEALVEALTQAREAAVKAVKEQIGVKALARVMADKAKAV